VGRAVSRRWRACWSATATTIAGPVIARQAIDHGIVPGDRGQIELWVAVFVACRHRRLGSAHVQSYLTSWVGERVLADLRVGLFAHIQRLDLGYFERTRAGVDHLPAHERRRGPEQPGHGRADHPGPEHADLIGSARRLLYLDWRLALATLTDLPGMTIGDGALPPLLGACLPAHARAAGRGHRHLQEDISGGARGAGVPARAGQLPRFVDVNGRYRGANVQTVNASAVYFPCVDLLSASAMAVVLGYGGLLVCSTGD
jgi:ATP-binding cassette subfamily B protein